MVCDALFHICSSRKKARDRRTFGCKKRPKAQAPKGRGGIWSGLGESNPPCAAWKAAARPIGQGRVCERLLTMQAGPVLLPRYQAAPKIRRPSGIGCRWQSIALLGITAPLAGMSVSASSRCRNQYSPIKSTCNLLICKHNANSRFAFGGAGGSRTRVQHASTSTSVGVSPDYSHGSLRADESPLVNW